MITPEEFPYITSLDVYDLFDNNKFDIVLKDYSPFSNLIITGKNGSGKTTILNHINKIYFNSFEVSKLILERTYRKDPNMLYDSAINFGSSTAIHPVSLKHSVEYMISENNTKPKAMLPHEYVGRAKNLAIYSYFRAVRDTKLDKVEGPVKESEFRNKLNQENSANFFQKKFKQYLVNKKIDQAFNQIDHNDYLVEQTRVFFEIIQKKLSILFDLPIKSIDFDHNNYEFYIKVDDGRILVFERLSAGFSSIVSLVISLMIETDLIRKSVDNYNCNPCGIVLIDEPETHLHLELQEQVLPLLTSLFPNIQFIVATHSPAVIASIKNATIFDLTTKETRTSEETVGRSYSELMTAHFGLKNTYSSIADVIISQINDTVAKYKNDVDSLKSELAKIYSENSVYLSPTLQVELELLIAQAEAKQAVAR